MANHARDLAVGDLQRPWATRGRLQGRVEMGPDLRMGDMGDSSDLYRGICLWALLATTPHGAPMMAGPRGHRESPALPANGDSRSPAGNHLGATRRLEVS